MSKTSLHWEVRTAGQVKPSFIVGTVHIGDERCHVYWPLISERIKVYDRVYTESSLSAEASRIIQPWTLLPPDVRYEDYISPRRWAKMTLAIERFTKVDIDMMKRVHPLFILTAIQVGMTRPSELPSLDQRIWDLAISLDKQVDGIESPLEQVDVLRSLDIGFLYLHLVRMSKKMSTTRRQFKKLIEVYQAQDINALYKMSKTSLGPDRRRLIDGRNTVIGQRILDQHRDEPSFFSFGAGHLGGSTGVIRYLKHSGAQLKPIQI